MEISKSAENIWCMQNIIKFLYFPVKIYNKNRNVADAEYKRADNMKTV